MVHGMQRWLCKSCGCNYTKSTPRGYQDVLEKQAVGHYLNGISLRKIEAIMGISNVTVLRWVRDFKGQLLGLLGRTAVADVQMRQMPLETVQKLLEKTPSNPRHHWVVIEVASDDIEGEGVLVIQPADKPTILDEPK